ncbi:piggyBac transposable element-derived protein 4-like protein, partial [Dinothrombium tinctorium]
MLRRFIRFDNFETRADRRKVDKLAPIREIFNKFSENCTNSYYPGKYLTVDEQLVGFKGRCPFRQYIANKPDKVGIKLWMIVCVDSKYVWKIQPYTGKLDGNVVEKNQPTRVVRDMIEGLKKGHNITTDNLFTSVKTAKMAFEHGHTVIGTLRKNKPEIPTLFSKTTGRKEYSTMFCFHENMTMVSYAPKKNRSVVLLSTMHHDKKVSDDAKNKLKPQIILDYNKTKGGVDTHDQMCKAYTCSLPSRRYTMRLLYSLLD